MIYDDIYNAYSQANKNLENQDKAAVKAIADKALADLATAQRETNANYDNAVATAYRQANVPFSTASGRYATQANAGNIEANYRQNQSYDNARANQLRTATNANLEQMNADITANYLPKRMEVQAEMAKQKQAEIDAANEAAEREKAQEGVMEKLAELSKSSNYKYDFDADIFELERQGLSSSDWQIQFLKEAKRRQTQALKELEASQKKTSGTGGKKTTSTDSDEVTAPSSATTTPLATRGVDNSTSNYKQLKERIGTYLNSPTGRQHTVQILERIENEQKAGNITETEARQLINLFELA